MIVQACQNFGALPVYYHQENIDMAQRASDENYVLLQRPHTVLLMATVAGLEFKSL